MLDTRVYTFLKLCDVMNYRVAAEELHISQPAVTQHIHYLESEYGVKFFNYSNKKLTKTNEGCIFECYARTAACNEKKLRGELECSGIKKFSVGATKTVADYIIHDQVLALINCCGIDLSLEVGSTDELLGMLDHSAVDIVLTEDFFDKVTYDFTTFKKEPIVGICAKGSPLAGRNVPIKEILKENIIMQCEGSGVRESLVDCIKKYNYSLDCFNSKKCICSFELIKELVGNGCGISFVYETIAKHAEGVETFNLDMPGMFREINFVYLKGIDAGKMINLFCYSEDDHICEEKKEA